MSIATKDLLRYPLTRVRTTLINEAAMIFVVGHLLAGHSLPTNQPDPSITRGHSPLTNPRGDPNIPGQLGQEGDLSHQTAHLSRRQSERTPGRKMKGGGEKPYRGSLPETSHNNVLSPRTKKKLQPYNSAAPTPSVMSPPPRGGRRRGSPSTDDEGSSCSSGRIKINILEEITDATVAFCDHHPSTSLTYIFIISSGGVRVGANIHVNLNLNSTEIQLRTMLYSLLTYHRISEGELTDPVRRQATTKFNNIQHRPFGRTPAIPFTLGKLTCTMLTSVCCRGRSTVGCWHAGRSVI
eukprot:sb/3467509/